MVYIGRDDDGLVIAVSDRPQTGMAEDVAADDPELLDFLGRTIGDGVVDPFQADDLAFVRVAEDLIEALLRKGIITMADLPADARDKLTSRRALRSALAGAGLFVASDD